MFALPSVRWAAASLALFAAGLAVQLPGGPAWAWWPPYLACAVAGGWGPALAGLRELRHRRLDVDLLMVLAAAGAAAIGQLTDGALLIVIFATSGALEDVATARTEDSVRGLLDRAPRTATVVSGVDGERTVPVAELVVGDEVLVRPGDAVPADGVVVAGAGEVDQATITGEPLPVGKGPGDEVYAGTLNGTGALRVRVARRAADSVLARIAELVERAGRTKARTQLFVERVEQRYSIGMVTATVALFAVPLLFGDPVTDALLRAMTFMIVASPCAVVLATMPPLLAAIATAGRHGVLVKSAVVLERLGTATAVAFDKTGTLTRGVPEVTEIHPDGPVGKDELLRLAAGAEAPSEHPLAAAVVRAARDRGIDVPVATAFTAIPGRGVRADVDGHHVRVTAAREPLAGLTTVAVRRDGETIGVLGLRDEVRPGAAAAVAAVAGLTTAPPVLLTGDNAAAAARVAALVGIADVRAGLLPEDKVAAVAERTAAGQRVLVVGDGVNDAPALAAAHAGIALGGAGSDLALHSADAVVVRDDLATIPAVIALARRARRTVTANLVLAAACIAALVAWDLAGHLPLPLGVAGHEGSTVLVGLNGLRLLRRTAWRS